MGETEGERKRHHKTKGWLGIGGMAGPILMMLLPRSMDSMPIRILLTV